MVNLFHFSNSADAKIRSGTYIHLLSIIDLLHFDFSILTSAINNEPLGPYNKELLDLSNFTYNPKSLTVVEDVLRKKLARIIASAEKPRQLTSSSKLAMGRSQSVGGNQSFLGRSHNMRRATSVHTTSSSDTKCDLVVLKCLTVIVYLCQYGSGLFINWLRSEYLNIIVPLRRLAFHPQYLNAIYLKVSLIVKYCEDDDQLASSRDSLDEMRREIRPGIVHHSVRVERGHSPGPHLANFTMGMRKKPLVL